MSEVLKFRSTAEIEEEASIWVWRLDDENATPQMRAEFEQWLRRDPRHRQAFEELGGVWRSLDELAEAKREEKVATFVAEERRLYTGAGRHRWRRWVPWAIAASLVVALGVASWLHRGSETRAFATAVGQQRSVTLADGSIVQLNTNTILDTHFTRTRRQVYLRKGEALFKVAHDTERPFLVHAGDVVVRAVGTEFNVRVRDSRDVVVIVAKGRVAVEPQPPAKGRTGSSGHAPSALPATRELAAGQRFETNAAVAVANISPTALSNSLAWSHGAIVFDGEPLVRAVAELNRYSDTRLVVADPSIDGLRVGGRFRTGDVEGFLKALTKAFPVTTHRTSDHLVYIVRRASASAPRLHQ